MPPRIDDREYRLVPVSIVKPTAEEREAGSAETVLEGYSVVWDSLSVEMWGFREKFEAGAFAANLRTDPDVKALVGHDPSKLLGRTTSGTLSVKEDDTGLLMRVTVPDTTLGRDTVTLVNRGDLTQMSFAFRTKSERWDQTDDGEIRTVTEADLFDVSLVTYPAYPETSVGVRSALMDHGFDAEAIVRCIERRRLGRDVLPDDQPVLRQAMSIIEALIGEETEIDCFDAGLQMTTNRRRLLDAAMRAAK